MTNQNRQLSGMLMMIGASVLFATGGLVLRFIDWPALAINGMRSLFGALVIGAYLLFTHRRVSITWPVLMGAVAYMGMTTLFVLANQLAGAANAIVLQYSCPIWIILLNFVFFRKKPSALEYGAVAIVLTGICCFFLDALGGGQMLGNLIAVTSGICYAVMFMLNSFEKGDALSSVFCGQIANVLFLGPTALPLIGQASGCDWLCLIWLGAFQVGLAYLLFSKATDRIPALQACLIGGFEPILNPLLVALVFHESLPWLSLLGAAIVIGGVLGYSLLDLKRTRLTG